VFFQLRYVYGYSSLVLVLSTTVWSICRATGERKKAVYDGELNFFPPGSRRLATAYNKTQSDANINVDQKLSERVCRMGGRHLKNNN